ncbi:hypothetical protein KDA00_01645 [Candidatus Saccharibacteria bacterium]|nr:hypothetical protein [Candidatus Saccharibacteria bacterium]
MKKPIQTKNASHKKRFGNHQKRTRSFHDTYLPYLPMTFILFLSVFISGYSPKSPGTLAYATEMSQQSLLNSTNSQRASNGKSGLTLNNQLSSAAQAKANDMVARNYWSHNTPDGQEPWVFVNGAGYSYIKAGENLAYGFATSSDAVQGWMNSPTHKANMLDGDFVDVGFGFANSSDYNNAGEETVVVAMYGKPYVLAATQESTPTEPTNSVPQDQSPAPQPSQEPIMAKPDTSNNSIKEEVKPSAETEYTAEVPQFVVASAKPVSRVEAVANWASPAVVGAISFITGLLITILIVRHSVRIKHLLKDSQNFITHHPLIDSTIFALVVLGITLSRTVGQIF